MKIDWQYSTRWIYHQKKNILWCKLNKIGSTNYAGIHWHMWRRENRSAFEHIDRYKLLYASKIKSEVEMKDVMSKAPFTFAVVRHPHERLVSYFNNLMDA